MLDASTITIVKSTLPALVATGPKLTTHFYQRMLNHHPELKNVFNLNNQTNGAQREALFNAICAYASNLDNLGALLPAVEKIAQKHASLSIQADQYPIVGEHLLATIRELLNPGDEVLKAWEKAYAVLAQIFINREAEIYQITESAPGGWRGTRPFHISAITSESTMIKSFTLTPVDNQPVIDFQPGQYLALYMQLPGSEYRKIRHYSLTRAANGSDYRIAVKQEAQGCISGWLHQHARTGDIIEVAAPAGDFFLQISQKTAPIVLISAGVGQTPMLAMLHSLVAQQYQGAVTWLHAAENGQTHAFASEVSSLGAQLADFSSRIWYHQPQEQDNTRYQASGLMDLTPVFNRIIVPQASYWLCGPLGFMQFVARQLLSAGIAAEQLHYEVFGPHKVI